MDRLSFECGNLRYVNGISPINVSKFYGTILELMDFHYASKLSSGRESNSALYNYFLIRSLNFVYMKEFIVILDVTNERVSVNKRIK